MLSLGIDWARAAMTAARRRAFASGSGRPILAATVISRLSLEKRAERFLSCAPFRYMMFLNLEWPAICPSCTPAKGTHQSTTLMGPKAGVQSNKEKVWAPAFAGERILTPVRAPGD